jgi:epoxide hydrolase-like predicted phosphatase
MIKAVLFDMVGPLLVKNPNYKPDVVVETAESLRAHAKDDKEFLRRLKEDIITENLELDDILDRIVNKYSKIEPVWNMLLPELKKRNHKLGVINNGTGLTITKFKDKNNFSQYFDLFMNSSEEKMEKPDPRIYLLTCKKLGVKPEECVFIDDTKENVAAANALGMAGFLYQNYPKLVSDLSSMQLIDAAREKL